MPLSTLSNIICTSFSSTFPLSGLRFCVSCRLYSGFSPKNECVLVFSHWYLVDYLLGSSFHWLVIFSNPIICSCHLMQAVKAPRWDNSPAPDRYELWVTDGGGNTQAVILFPHLRPFYFDYALVKSFCELVILAVNAQLWRVFIKSCLDGRWNSGPAGDSSRLVALVIFIGGVTFAEISALRFLSAQVSHLLLVSLFCLILLWVTKTLSLSHWSR